MVREFDNFTTNSLFRDYILTRLSTSRIKIKTRNFIINTLDKFNLTIGDIIDKMMTKEDVMLFSKDPIVVYIISSSIRIICENSYLIQEEYETDDEATVTGHE